MTQAAQPGKEDPQSTWTSLGIFPRPTHCSSPLPPRAAVWPHPDPWRSQTEGYSPVLQAYLFIAMWFHLVLEPALPTHVI